MMTPAPAMSRQDWTILLALSVIWGGSFFFIEVALGSFGPLSLVLVRVAMASAFLWLFLAMKRERMALPAGAALSLLILALLNNVIPFILFADAQREITGGLGSILNATTPIWGVIVAHLFTADEKATPGKVFGVALGFAGVAVTMGVGSLGGLGEHAVAQFECLGATLCYGLAGVYARRFPF